LVSGTSAHAYSETVAAGSVIDQSPSGGATVDEGTTVSCTISDGSAPSGDTVSIIKAEYKSDKSELKVEATSSDGGNVTLTVVDYGDMTWIADKNKYEYKAKPAANPGANVIVTSSGGGQATKSVTHK
jgi:beta-lactam-binding protein with PASTA domain